MNTENQITSPRHIVVTSTKSVGIQILLILFLGPFGLFYSTVKGALIMLFGVPLFFAVIGGVLGSAISSGAGAGVAVGIGSSIVLTLATWWIGSFIWGVIAVNAFNKAIMQSSQKY